MKNIRLFIFILLCFISLPQLYAQYDLETNEYLVNRFIDKNGKLIDEIIVPGKPPESYRDLVSRKFKVDGDVILSNVPAFTWSFGCSPTAAAMMAGYYDNGSYPNIYTGPTNGGIIPLTNVIWGEWTDESGASWFKCPLSATQNGLDGRKYKGNVDDNWIYFGNNKPDPYVGKWTMHIEEDCTADYMGTNQSEWQNVDGGTRFFYIADGSPLYDYKSCGEGSPKKRDGNHGLKLFFESRGYTVNSNYSQYIVEEGQTFGFSFFQYTQEIDAGRPVIIHVHGHSMLGVGYNYIDNVVYLHDTWDHNMHTMTWGDSYSGMRHFAVTVCVLDAAPANVYVQNKNFTRTEYYEALSELHIGNDVKINRGANISFKAGEKVFLEDGFYARAGSEFVLSTSTIGQPSPPDSIIIINKDSLNRK
ncbi:C39 family peptidase, partial [Bacteroidota bacterium]